jgi:site-specific recombinase XerC
LGTAPNRKAPATAGLAKVMARSYSVSLVGLRDRAIVLLGFAGALRRSELVALDVADIETTEKGLLVRISRSKTDQEAEGTIVAISRGSAYCPAEALLAWLKLAGIAALPKGLFFARSGDRAKFRLAKISR